MQMITPDSFRPKIPAAILIVGSLAGKLISWLSNIDFLLSIKHETFLLMLGWLISYGWWFMAGVGVIWAYNARGTSRIFGPSLVTVVGVLAFVWGILLTARSEEHTSELQSRSDLVCRLLLEKKKKKKRENITCYK